jgi:galactose mutarotase-like enzyme
MPVKTFTVVDPTRAAVKDFTLTAADFGREIEGVRVERRKLHGGLSDAVETIHVNNGKLAFTVLPTRGMGIWKARLGKHEFGWKSPVRGPVHPQYVDLGEPSGLGWLDGFDELFVRCGLESNGAPEFDAKTGRLKYPLHGRIANKPAQECDIAVDSDKGEIAVRGTVEETRFLFTKLRMRTTITTQLNESGFTVRDEIENFSASPATAQMLYHINFGLPLLDGGARVILPAKQIVPRNARAAAGLANWDSYQAGEPGFEEQVYFFELVGDKNGATQVLLKNAHSTLGVSLHFNTKQLPCFSLWKNTAAHEDGYVTGIEPGTNFPNPRSFETEHDRVLKLAAGEKKTLEVRMEIHDGAAAIADAERAIKTLQGSTKPVMHDKPWAEWCAP